MTVRADISRQDLSQESERSYYETTQRPKRLPVRKLYRVERRITIIGKKVRNMTNNTFMRVDDVAAELGVSKS